MIPEKAEELAEKHAGAQVFSSHSQLRLEADIDAAIICTPPLFHTEQACEMLENGVHVLCEKPLAITVADAECMVVAAENSGAVFTMASKYRFVPDVIQAREMIQSGAIGDVILYENQFASKVDMSLRWNSNPEVSGGGVLIDNGTHSLDIMRYFLGAVNDITVVEGKRVQNLQVEDTVHIFVRTKTGTLGSIDLSWCLNKISPWFIKLHGTDGGIQIGWNQSVQRLSGETDWTPFGTGYDKRVAFRGQLTNFVNAIHGREEVIVTPAEGVGSVAAVVAAYDAMRRVEWMPVGR
jgi:predicted dehydrogenase